MHELGIPLSTLLILVPAIIHGSLESFLKILELSFVID